MNSNQIFPFERNRYYAGKMLTSADFQAEQSYFNNKSRFLNSLMYGAGIVCGCGVFNLDDLSILVESGVAIDGLGREIVLDSSVVKKLSAVEGFDSLRTNRAALCLRFKEEPVHTVYAVNRGEADKDYEYNRISEGYQLFLQDSETLPEEFEMETEFLTSGLLLATADYTVEVLVPATVCKGKPVKAVLRVTKQSAEDVKLTLHGGLQVPTFETAEGTHELSIDLDDIALPMGEKYEKEFWMKAQDTVQLETNILLKSGTAIAYINDQAVPVMTDFGLKVSVANISPRALVAREIGRMNLELRQIGEVKDYIQLAELELVRTDSAYVIEKVLESGVKKYISAPAQDLLRESYLEYFEKYQDITAAGKTVVAPKTEAGPSKVLGDVPEVATGVLEIPLGENARRGDIFYSGEIMHGLGKGNVYVQIGSEFISEDAALGANAKSTVYGNADLFKKDRTPAANVETAVKVLNDKGSFVVAAKLQENTDYLVLTYRWVAIRFPAGNEIGFTDDFVGKSISAETPTVVLGTKESHYFGVKFNNCDPCSIAYELTEEGSGEISSDGVYTAPAREGVYEIRIFCTDMPVICTYAYAIVKKKGLEDGTEEKA